ncbi:uncharacterized protein LOC116621519 isoform X2 [Nematostella vectensis]|nr:uncharacterized protein LOC116621519 isoform X2 [Nematostella vectensis]XP_032243229.2 uncharacterized protein LOC116621519 isoform X2 [Nematostella vectensis]
MKEQRGIEDCACNCGTGQQCSIKPGLGDTPELAAQSCSEIFTNRPGPLQDGPYYLKANKLPVYCHMTAIDGCEGEGGWTLVMKINGSMGTFAYSSSRWSSQYEYNTEAGGDLDETETRLGTFRSLIFQQICLGMKTPDSSSIRWISYHLSSGANLFETMITPHAYVDFASSRPEDWEKLIPSATIKTMETKDGINVVPDGDNGAKARIGIVGKGAQGWDSYIGFGTVGTSANPTLSCGNVDGSKHTPAFGYILVK